jgi:predicted nucleic acid-binding protein
MNNIIVDTGFWYALYDSSDQHHSQALALAGYLELGNILIPFPTLYESINTRFSKQKEWMEEFEKLIEQENVIRLDDADYKDTALSLTFDTTLIQKRPISLVDSLIRVMLDDPRLKIDYLISFNVGDFADVCQRRGIEILFS